LEIYKPAHSLEDVPLEIFFAHDELLLLEFFKEYGFKKMLVDDLLNFV